jgi:hypothetical protein
MKVTYDAAQKLSLKETLFYSINENYCEAKLDRTRYYYSVARCNL